MSDSGFSPSPFPATRWSIVTAATGDAAAGRQALEEICRLYWYPLYAFARQRGCSPEDAADRTQEFLASVAGGRLLSGASPTRGRLRTYFLAAFQRDLVDEHRRARRIKRGGGAETVTLDTMHAEDRFADAASTGPAESVYDRAWALTCLESATAALEAEYAARGRAALFGVLRAFLDTGEDGDYAVAAAATGLEGNALRQAVFRLRQRFRVLLREVVADTLAQPTEALVDEELASLRAALACPPGLSP